MSTWRKTAVAAALCTAPVLLSGCGGDGGAATARAACLVQGQSSPGFNPETALLSELSGNARLARERSALANEAAAQDQRWQVISDASDALASFAEVLVQARMDGLAISDVTTPQMWDQAKFASDALLAECRLALR